MPIIDTLISQLTTLQIDHLSDLDRQRLADYLQCVSATLDRTQQGRSADTPGAAYLRASTPDRELFFSIRN